MMKHASDHGMSPAVVVALLFALASTSCKPTYFNLEPDDAARLASCDSVDQEYCRRCNGGDIGACVELADDCDRRAQREYSSQASELVHLSAMFWGRACELGHAPACVFAGQGLADRVIAAPLQRGSLESLRNSACRAIEGGCDDEHVLACRAHGLCKSRGWGGAADVQEAARALERACLNDDHESCAMLGELRGRFARDNEAFRAAFEAYKAACDHEADKGCLGVIAHLYYGIGVQPDSERAMAMAESGCLIGSSLACDALFFGYFSGALPWMAQGANRLAEPDPSGLLAHQVGSHCLPAVGRLGFCVAQDGRVVDARTLQSSGDPIFDEMVLTAARSWKFDNCPALTHGDRLCASREYSVRIPLAQVYAGPDAKPPIRGVPASCP